MSLDYSQMTPAEHIERAEGWLASAAQAWCESTYHKAAASAQMAAAHAALAQAKKGEQK